MELYSRFLSFYRPKKTKKKEKFLPSGLDALPGGGQFDEDALLGDALLGVEFHDLQRLLDATFFVKRETSVDLFRRKKVLEIRLSLRSLQNTKAFTIL